MFVPVEVPEPAGTHRLVRAVATFVTSDRLADFRFLFAIAEFWAVETGLFASLVLSTFQSQTAVLSSVCQLLSPLQ